MGADARMGWTRVREIAGRAVGPAALLGWCALAWRWRPRDPFEWDEYLYLRGLEHYDVSLHAPHPPGAPVYMFLGWLLRLVLGDGLRALQLLAVLAGAACLALLWSTARRHAGAERVAWASALGLAALPGFLFYANVGLTDVPALACLLGAWAVGLAALDRPRWLWAVAVLAALGVGVRPAVLPALVPLAVALLVSAWRERRWRELGLAAACGLGASLVIWLPAIWITGPTRYFEALRLQADWVATSDAASTLGRADLRELARHWLQYPFGHRRVARLVWLAAVVGAVGWWRAGHRRPVLLVGGGGLLYLVLAMLTLHQRWGVRYGLPLLPVLALGAAGNLLWRGRPARWVAAAALVGAGGYMVWETAPVMQLRRRPTPVNAAFDFVRDSYEPKRTHLVFGRDVAPHGEWLLPRLGLHGELWQKGRYYLRTSKDMRDVVVVTTEPIPGFSTVFERTWASTRYPEMTWGRYSTAVVQVPPPGVGTLDVPGLEMGEQSWRVRRGGTVALPAGGWPKAFELCPLSTSVTVRQPGREAREVWPGECADLLLLPGPEGRIGLESAEDGALVQPFVFTPVAGGWAADTRVEGRGLRRFPRGPAWVVPVVARLDGAGGARWVSELEVANRGGVAGEVVIARLPSKRKGSVLPALQVALTADQSLRLDDVLARPELGAEMPVGALLVGLDVFNPEAEVGLEVRARTFNQRGSGGTSDGALPGVPLDRGLLPGESAGLGEIAVAAGDRVAVGAASVGSSAVKLTFVASRLDGVGEVRRDLSAPVLGHSQEPWALPPGRWRVTVKLAPGDPGLRVVPYLSHVGRDGRSTYLAGSSQVSRGFGSAILVNAHPLSP